MKNNSMLHTLTLAILMQLALILMPLHTSAQTSERNFSFAVYSPVQLDFQKAEITFGPDEIQKNTAINYGIAGLVNLRISKRCSVFAAAGYFREQFNIRRPYDHRALNGETDSIPIVTKTDNYVYNLLILPVGFKYDFTNNNFFLGFEYVPCINFSSSYNGAVLSPTANTKQHNVFLFSHFVNLFISLPVKINSSVAFSLEPFIRIIHLYKKDPILYENQNNYNSRSLDAIGIRIKYEINARH